MNDGRNNRILTFKVVDKYNSSQDEIALSIEDSKKPIYVSDKDMSFRWISKRDAHFININEHKFKISVEKHKKMNDIKSFSSSYSSSNIRGSNSFNSNLGINSDLSGSGFCSYGLSLI